MSFVQNIFPIIGLFALAAYLFYVGIDAPTNRKWTSIGVMLGSALIGLLATIILAKKFEPGKNKRAINELCFQFLYSPMNFTIFYQYFSQITNVYKADLEKDSTLLFILEQIAFFWWGVAIGNNLAVSLINRQWVVPTTSHLTFQELGNMAMEVLFPLRP